MLIDFDTKKHHGTLKLCATHKQPEYILSNCNFFCSGNSTMLLRSSLLRKLRRSVEEVVEAKKSL